MLRPSLSSTSTDTLCPSPTLFRSKESGGNAVLMYWTNPLAPPDTGKSVPGLRDRVPSSVRVATVQFQMRRIDTIDQFEERSEEHTSELQSLMRNSYDVFCLKTKTE